MVQNPSWEANRFAASQEIHRISRNPKVHYRTHKRPPPVSILGQPNPVHIPTSQLLEIHPNNIHPSTPRSLQWSPSLRVPHQDPIQPPLLTHTCPAHPILLHFITRTILGEEYRSFSSSSFNLLHSPVSLLSYLITYLLYSMVQNPSWAPNLFAASQEIPRISRNPKVHSRTHNRPPPVSILGQPNPVHIPTSHLLEIHPNNIHPSTPRSLQWSPSLRFPQKEPIHPLSSPIRATCPAHLILLDFITKIATDNKIIEQVQLFNYLGNMISYEELDIDKILNNFLKITVILNNVFRPQKPLRKQQ